MSDVYYSPGKLLANFYQLPGSRLYLLSGDSGCGKTSWCLQLVCQTKQQNIPVQGLVSPAVFVDGKKTAIDVIKLPDSAPCRLAERRAGECQGLCTGEWLFDESQMAWADQQLAHLQPTDLLILDELGPLEFNQGRGWQSAFPLIEQRAYHLAVVVIRPSLVAEALQRWRWAETIIFPALPTTSTARLDDHDQG